MLGLEFAEPGTEVWIALSCFDVERALAELPLPWDTSVSVTLHLEGRAGGLQRKSPFFLVRREE